MKIPSVLFVAPLVLALGSLLLVAARAGDRGQPASPAAVSEDATLLVSPKLPLEGTPREARDEAPAPRGTGFFDLPPGRRFVHAFEAELTTRLAQELEPGQAGEMEVGLRIAGKLSVTVLTARAEDLFLRLSLEEVTFAASGATLEADPRAQAAVAAELALTSSVRVARDGRTLGFRFPEGARAETRNLVRSLWSALHAVILDGDEPAWTVDESDATGPLRMEYAWLGAPVGGQRSLAKTRRDPLGSEQPTSADGTGELVLDLGLRWIRRASYAEDARLAAPEAGLRATQHARYAFELVEHGRVDVDVAEVDLDSPWASPSGRNEGQEAASSAFHPSGGDADRTAFEPLVLEIAALMDAGLHDSRELYEAQMALAELLEADPSRFEALHELFLAGVVRGDTAMVVLAAVGMARGPEAQDFLARVLSSDETPLDQRLASLRSSFQVAAPTPAFLEVLRSTYADADEPALRTTALLSLGALSSREGSGETLAYLLEREEDLRTDTELIQWLEALGNSGAADILPRVQAYLEHANARVRASAVSALRHLSGPEPVPWLARSATEDPDAGVRALAVELLALCADPEALETVRGVLAHDPSPLVRRRTLQALGSLSPRPDAALALILEARADLDEGVRRLAESLLAE